MSPRQMSPLQLESVQDGPSNLSLSLVKIGPVTAEILLTLSLWWVGSGLKLFYCQTQLRSR